MRCEECVYNEGSMLQDKVHRRSSSVFKAQAQRSWKVVCAATDGKANGLRMNGTAAPWVVWLSLLLLLRACLYAPFLSSFSHLRAGGDVGGILAVALTGDGCLWYVRLRTRATTKLDGSTERVQELASQKIAVLEHMPRESHAVRNLDQFLKC